jgi:PAS domain S-box-containing protein/diguanylate cyclase (GGDEF)-like protein
MSVPRPVGYPVTGPLPAVPGQQPRTIAVLAPFIGGFYFGNVLTGATRAAATGNHALLAVQTLPAGLDRGDDPESAPQDAQVEATRLCAVRLATRGASGLILVSTAVRSPHLEQLHRTGRPMVLISNDATETRLPVASPDNVGGVRAAVDHLVEHGHRRIGFVGSLTQPDLAERHEAYRQRLRDHEITPDPHWLFETADTLESGGGEAARRMLAADLPTTALFVATDRNAIGVIRVLTDAGLSLPRQQAIIGFDNTGAGARARPRLTSVEPHFDRVGELAVQLLIDRRRTGTGLTGPHRTATSLVVRESCGCSTVTGGPNGAAGSTRADEDAHLLRQGQLEASLTAQVEIGMELLRPGRADPRRLAWLAASRLSAACLALWSPSEGSTGDDPAERRLRIAGVYQALGAGGGAGPLGRLVGVGSALGDFPPTAIKDHCRPSAGEAVIVLPVTSERRDWGLLAVVGPVEHQATSVRDDYNHWATQLAVALEQDELRASEQRQREHLEQAYRRERELADTIRVSEERYALVAQATDDGLWDWDVSAGTVYYSPRWKSMLGYAQAEIGASPADWLDRVHPDDRKELAAAVAAQLGGAQSPLEVQHRIRTRDGGYRWVLCRALTVVDDAGSPSRLVGALIDLTGQKALEEQLRRGALQDPSTQLPNRALFLDRLGIALGRARRHPAYDAAVLVIRLDLPRATGAEQPGVDPEAVVRRLGRRLAAELSEPDSSGRLGAAELAVLLDDVKERDVPALVARIEGVLSQPLILDGHRVGLRVSLGLAPDCGRHDSVEAVLREADVALHRAQARRARPEPDVANL